MISILFLAADPTDASRLRLGEEIREIREKLQLAKSRDRFALHQRMSVRPADISQALLDVNPQIVHFSGHGTITGAICIEDKMGKMHPIQPRALAALFEQFTNRVKCVILNACYSETQARAIAKHIDCVIGMNQAIGDKAAIAFSVGFYQALGAGRSIAEAHELGCVQIMLENIPEHLTPVLVERIRKSEDTCVKTASTVTRQAPSPFQNGRPLLPTFPYFIYISDSKIEMLEEQVLWQGAREKHSRKRFQKLTSILTELRNQDQVGDIHSGKPFIYGDYSMKWGMVDWGVCDADVRVSFFLTAKTDPVLLMAGSVHHLVGEKSMDYAFPRGSFGYSGSHLPGIMRAIRFSYRPRKWTEQIGGIYDYVSALAFVQDKFVHRSLVKVPFTFPEQDLTFVARTLKHLACPSREEFQKFLTDARMQKDDEQELTEMFKEGKDVLICTPLYVALAETQ